MVRRTNSQAQKDIRINMKQTNDNWRKRFDEKFIINYKEFGGYLVEFNIEDVKTFIQNEIDKERDRTIKSLTFNNYYIPPHIKKLFKEELDKVRKEERDKAEKEWLGDAKRLCNVSLDLSYSLGRKDGIKELGKVIRKKNKQKSWD